MHAAAVIVAAGRSTRFPGERPKQFVRILDRPLLAWTISRFEAAASIAAIVLVVAEEEMLSTSQEIVDQYAFRKVTKIVAGGMSRRESVLNGLEALPGQTQLVAIHDGARPAVLPADINRVVERALLGRAAILAQPIFETVKQVQNHLITGTVPRESLMAAQTPQVFDFELILDAHRSHLSSDEITDDASLLEPQGIPIAAVIPSNRNPKVTTPEDIPLVAQLLAADV